MESDAVGFTLDFTFTFLAKRCLLKGGCMRVLCLCLWQLRRGVGVVCWNLGGKSEKCPMCGLSKNLSETMAYMYRGIATKKLCLLSPN